MTSTTPDRATWPRRAAYMSTGRAGQLLGYTAERIRQLCAAGRIPGAKQLGEGGHWRVPVEWVREHMGEPVRRRRSERRLLASDTNQGSDGAR